jgi:phage baseplate assembly protein gpV
MDMSVLDGLMDVLEARHYGKYRGEVVNNVDPQSQGRLQVLVPAILSDAPVWALPCVPYAGDGVGFYALPNPGSRVWVEFEGGDIGVPIWAGCFWPENHSIPADNALPSNKVFKTDAVTLSIDDALGQVEIKTRSGSAIKITAAEITIKAPTVTQSAQGGRTRLTPVSFDVNNGAFTVI